MFLTSSFTFSSRRRHTSFLSSSDCRIGFTSQLNTSCMAWCVWSLFTSRVFSLFPVMHYMLLSQNINNKRIINNQTLFMRNCLIFNSPYMIFFAVDLQLLYPVIPQLDSHCNQLQQRR